MLFLRLHGQGIVINEIFWGLWLFPFGVLVMRSGFLPRILGVWLIVNGFAYLAASLTSLLLPGYAAVVRTDMHSSRSSGNCGSCCGFCSKEPRSEHSWPRKPRDRADRHPAPRFHDSARGREPRCAGPRRRSEAKRPLTALPYTPSLDVAAMEPQRRPVHRDFYQYSVRRLDRRPTRFQRTRRRGASTASSTDENEQFLWGLLEDAARPAKEPHAGAAEDRRHYFPSCMDEGGGRRRRGPSAARAGASANRRAASPSDLPRICGGAAGDARRRGAVRTSAAPRTSVTRRRSSPSWTRAGSACRIATTSIKDDAQSKEDPREVREATVERMLVARRREGQGGGATVAETVLRIETARQRRRCSRRPARCRTSSKI